MSAGLLLYRVTHDRVLEVLLVHPGGPLWKNRDDGVWSLPKGEVDGSDDPGSTAEREFAEELGTPPPAGVRIDLGQVIQKSGKRVVAWAVAGDFDAETAHSNSFDLEWPPKSGQRQSFPEVDRAAWFELPEARVKLIGAQCAFLDRLALALGREGREI